MLARIFRDMVSRVTSDPVRDYEAAKCDVTRKISGGGMTCDDLETLSREADRSIHRIQMSMRGGMR